MPAFTRTGLQDVMRAAKALHDSLQGQIAFARDSGEIEIARKFKSAASELEDILDILNRRLRLS